MRPAVAGAALFPQAVGRSAGAVRDISDSSLIMRLTRGRGWIAVLGALLDALKTEVSGLRAQIDQRLSASRVEAEAARLGLAVPNPRAITYLDASDADAERLSHLLATDSFLMAPSLPSSYPAPGTSYAPVSPSAPAPTTTTSVPSTPAPTTTAPDSGGGSGSGASTGSGTSSGSTSSTGGVGL
jgi:hypothetical protein